MAINKSLAHARHNNAAIKYLDRSPDHLDWVITMCFYSSLHYIRAILFPMTINPAGGKAYTIETFDGYCRKKNAGRIYLSKHEHILNLVFENCPDISYEYNQLYDMSSTARYRDYATDRDMSNAAKRFHETIKNYCEGLLSST